MLQKYRGNVARSLRLAAPLALLFTVSALGQNSSSHHVADKAAKPNAAKRTFAEKVNRWLEVDALAIATRYRFIKTRAHLTAANQAQFQVVARGRFKFDRKGKYSVYAGVFTGNNITGSWNNSGWGTGDPQSHLYLKQLYFDAKPAKWVEVQVGGLGGYNGENTEITGLDNDVYLMGERVFLRRPKDLNFDEVAITNAFIGDATTPNVFRRFHRLDESNYRQVLVRKQVDNRLSFSADYTFERGVHALHQAVSVKASQLVVDRVRFENYQRIDSDGGYGFAISGDKRLHERLTLGGGFARIDRPMFNADGFPPGNRLFRHRRGQDQPRVLGECRLYPGCRFPANAADTAHAPQRYLHLQFSGEPASAEGPLRQVVDHRSPFAHSASRA